MELSGKVYRINAEQQVSASFKKRELVIETEEQYPQKVMIEFTQDKCDLLNNYSTRDVVKVSINIRGREWINPEGEAKFFNSIQGWRIERLGVQQTPTPSNSTSGSAVDQYMDKPDPSKYEEDHDDLPFN